MADVDGYYTGGTTDSPGTGLSSQRRNGGAALGTTDSPGTGLSSQRRNGSVLDSPKSGVSLVIRYAGLNEGTQQVAGTS